MTFAARSASKSDSDIPVADKPKITKSNNILDKKRLALLLFSAVAFEVSDDVANMVLGVDGESSENYNYIYLLYFMAVFGIGDLVLKSYRKSRKNTAKKANVQASMDKYMPKPRDEQHADDSVPEATSEQNAHFKARAAKRMAFNLEQRQMPQGAVIDDPRTDLERRLDYVPSPLPPPGLNASHFPRPKNKHVAKVAKAAGKDHDVDTIARALDNELRSIARERASDQTNSVPEWRRHAASQDQEVSHHAPHVLPAASSPYAPVLKEDSYVPAPSPKDSDVVQKPDGETMVWCSRWHDPNEELTESQNRRTGIDNRPWPANSWQSSERWTQQSGGQGRRKGHALEQAAKDEEKASKAKQWKPKSSKEQEVAPKEGGMKNDVPIHM